MDECVVGGSMKSGLGSGVLLKVRVQVVFSSFFSFERK